MTAGALDSRAELPEAARRYLDHAIASNPAPMREVALRMHGEIRLKGWVRFKATETMLAGRDLRWEARTSDGKLPVSNFDEVVRGWLRWLGSLWERYGRSRRSIGI